MALTCNIIKGEYEFTTLRVSDFSLAVRSTHFWFRNFNHLNTECLFIFYV